MAQRAAGPLKAALLLCYAGLSSAFAPTGQNGEGGPGLARLVREELQDSGDAGEGGVADAFRDADLDEEPPEDISGHIAGSGDQALAEEVSPEAYKISFARDEAGGRKDVDVYKAVPAEAALAEKASTDASPTGSRKRKFKVRGGKLEQAWEPETKPQNELVPVDSKQEEDTASKAVPEESALVEGASQEAAESSDGERGLTNASTGDRECCADIPYPWGKKRVCVKFTDKSNSCPGGRTGGAAVCGVRWEKRDHKKDPDVLEDNSTTAWAEKCPKWKCAFMLNEKELFCKEVRPNQMDEESFECDGDEYGNGRCHCSPALSYKLFAIRRPTYYNGTCEETNTDPSDILRRRGVVEGFARCCHYAEKNPSTGVADYKQCVYNTMDNACGDSDFQSKFTGGERVHQCRMDEFGDRRCPPPVNKKVPAYLEEEGDPRPVDCNYLHNTALTTMLNVADLFRVEAAPQKVKEAWEKRARWVKVFNGKVTGDRHREEFEELNHLTFGDVLSADWYEYERWRMHQVGLLNQTIVDKKGKITAVNVELELKHMSLHFMWALQGSTPIRRALKKACGHQSLVKDRKLSDTWMFNGTQSPFKSCLADIQKKTVRPSEVEQASTATNETDLDDDGVNELPDPGEGESEGETDIDSQVEELRNQATSQMSTEDRKKLANFDGGLHSAFSNISAGVKLHYPDCDGIPSDTVTAFMEWSVQKALWDFHPPSPLWKMEDAEPLGKDAKHGHAICTPTGHRISNWEFTNPARRSAAVTCPEGTHCRCPKSVFFKKRNLKTIRSGVTSKTFTNYAGTVAQGSSIKAVAQTAVNFLPGPIGPIVLLGAMAWYAKKGKWGKLAATAVLATVGYAVGLFLAAHALPVIIAAIPLFLLARLMNSFTQRCEARTACYPADIVPIKDTTQKAWCGMTEQEAKLGGSLAWFLPPPGTATYQKDGKCSKLNRCPMDEMIGQKIGWDENGSLYNCQPLKVDEMTQEQQKNFAKKVWSTTAGVRGAWTDKAKTFCEVVEANCQEPASFLNMSLASSSLEAGGADIDHGDEAGGAADFDSDADVGTTDVDGHPEAVEEDEAK